MSIIINISGVIGWDATPADLREALRRANGEEVEVHISSPGGFVSDGLEMFNLLRDYPGPINGVLKGYAMSMGSYIPLAIPLNRHAPGKLRAESNAIYMIHNALGGVWGNHHKVLSYGETLKGMSNMIAREYARRTGRALEDVQAMMDKETYLFGEQIQEHGFVDEVLDVADEEDSDAASAQAAAQAMFTGMMARMTADQARMESDLQNVAQMLAVAGPDSTPPPAAAGTTQKEVQQMSTKSLAVLLAENPAAAQEHATQLANARTEGEAAGRQAVENRIKAAAPFLNNATYPPTVHAVALKVVTGEAVKDTLEAVVASVDAVREATATTAATTATATTGDTPAAPQQPVKAEGLVSSDAELDAACAQLKGGK